MRTIAARLLMAFLCVILFLVAQSVFSHVVTTNISAVQRDALSRELHLESLQERLARARLTVFKILGTMNPSEMDRLRKTFDRDMATLTEEIVAEGVDPGLAEKNAALYREIIGLHYDFSIKTARTRINAASKEVHEDIVERLKARGLDLALATQARVRKAHLQAHRDLLRHSPLRPGRSRDLGVRSQAQPHRPAPGRGAAPRERGAIQADRGELL